MTNINQNLADSYAGIASDAAKLTAEATAETLKHQFAASKDATVKAYKKAKEKMAGTTQAAKEKLNGAKESTGNFMHKVGDKIKETTSNVLEKTADVADSLADKARVKASQMG